MSRPRNAPLCPVRCPGAPGRQQRRLVVSRGGPPPRGARCAQGCAGRPRRRAPRLGDRVAQVHIQRLLLGRSLRQRPARRHALRRSAGARGRCADLSASLFLLVLDLLASLLVLDLLASLLILDLLASLLVPPGAPRAGAAARGAASPTTSSRGSAEAAAAKLRGLVMLCATARLDAEPRHPEVCGIDI